MAALSVIVTLLIFAVLIVAIIKKYNIVVTLLFLTLAGFFFATIIHGGSTLGEDASSGSKWIDIFEQFGKSFSGTLASTGLIIMTVLGYTQYMTSIKAFDMFAGICAIPISKIKAKFLLVAVTPLIGLLFIWVIPSGMSAFVVALGTVYPLLLIAGVNPLTAAIAIFLGCNVFCGPSSPFTLMMLQQLHLNESIGVAAFFVQYSAPIGITMEIVMGVVFAFWSRHLDKKLGHVVAPNDYKALDVSKLGIPKFYALFPLFPLVFIIIFSNFIVGSVVISIVSAQIVSLCIVVAIHIICTKKGERKAAYNGVNEFFKAMGGAFSNVVAVVASAMFLASAITALGGMSVIIKFFVGGLGMGFWGMLTILVLLFFLMACTAGPAAAIPVIGPAIYSVAATTGCMDLLPMACVMLVTGGGLGLMIKPFDPKLVMMAEMFKIDVFHCIRYSIVPAVSGLIAVCLMSVLLYGGL